MFPSGTRGSHSFVGELGLPRPTPQNKDPGGIRAPLQLLRSPQLCPKNPLLMIGANPQAVYVLWTV